MKSALQIRIPVPKYIRKYIEYKFNIDFENGDRFDVDPNKPNWLSKIIVMISDLEEKAFYFDYNTKENDSFIPCDYPNDKNISFPWKDHHFRYINSYIYDMFNNEFSQFVDNICVSDKILESFSLEIFNALIADKQINYETLQRAKKVFHLYVREMYKKDAILLFMRKVDLDEDDICFHTLIKRLDRNVKEKDARSIKELRSTLFYMDLEKSEQFKTLWHNLFNPSKNALIKQVLEA